MAVPEKLLFARHLGAGDTLLRLSSRPHDPTLKWGDNKREAKPRVSPVGMRARQPSGDTGRASLQAAGRTVPFTLKYKVTAPKVSHGTILKGSFQCCVGKGAGWGQKPGGPLSNSAGQEGTSDLGSSKGATRGCLAVVGGR